MKRGPKLSLQSLAFPVGQVEEPSPMKRGPKLGDPLVEREPERR